ncbi:hypothetical protein [Limnobacter sp.]|uniref:hypothetical protein n=1 Tax=Limnobacter sp. TaxID=2003368 RepID=UPI0027BA0124|nr:hypothetical protein [Limnobacter sp.]
MSATFSEKKLELEYYDLWKKHFFSCFKTNQFETFIPGREEVHVGFDLGFSAKNSKFKFTADDFFEWIKNRVQSPSRKESAFLFAYFYQYKLIEELEALSIIKDKALLAALTNSCGFKEAKPAYRAKLDTKPKQYDKGTKTRPYSQHEALFRLSKVPKASVAYCTPKFIKSDGFPVHKKLSDLCLTAVEKNTPLLNDGQSHHLYFSDKPGTLRYWCSDPINAPNLNNEYSQAMLMTPTELFRLLKFNYLAIEHADLNFETIEIDQSDMERRRFMQFFDALPSCTRLMVVPRNV